MLNKKGKQNKRKRKKADWLRGPGVSFWPTSPTCPRGPASFPHRAALTAPSLTDGWAQPASPTCTRTVHWPLDPTRQRYLTASTSLLVDPPSPVVVFAQITRRGRLGGPARAPTAWRGPRCRSCPWCCLLGPWVRLHFPSPASGAVGRAAVAIGIGPRTSGYKCGGRNAFTVHRARACGRELGYRAPTWLRAGDGRRGRRQLLAVFCISPGIRGRRGSRPAPFV
jgi:hypothetical protein